MPHHYQPISKLSIIVPVYNEENTVGQVIKKLIDLNLGKTKKEIIIVDDASTDNTPSIIQRLVENKAYIRVINHHTNRGKGAALQSGLKIATGNYTIFQDADLEYSPEEIPQLMNSVALSKSLAVFGSRDSHIKNHYSYWYLYYGSKLLAALVNLLFRQNLTDPETCYKLINTKLLRSLHLEKSGFGIEIEIVAKIAKMSITIKETPITYNPRSYSLGKKIHISDGLRALYLIFKYRLIST
jgi:glycosyltransferase involved in cell wall biosynthesis